MIDLKNNNKTLAKILASADK